MNDFETAPQFPIRIIFDDGACEFIDTPDELCTKIGSIDSTTPGSGIWIRDEQDRTVDIRMVHGQVELLSLAR